MLPSSPSADDRSPSRWYHDSVPPTCISAALNSRPRALNSFPASQYAREHSTRRFRCPRSPSTFSSSASICRRYAGESSRNASTSVLWKSDGSRKSSASLRTTPSAAFSWRARRVCVSVSCLSGVVGRSPLALDIASTESSALCSSAMEALPTPPGNSLCIRSRRSSSEPSPSAPAAPAGSALRRPRRSVYFCSRAALSFSRCSCCATACCSALFSFSSCATRSSSREMRASRSAIASAALSVCFRNRDNMRALRGVPRADRGRRRGRFAGFSAGRTQKIPLPPALLSFLSSISVIFHVLFPGFREIVFEELRCRFFFSFSFLLFSPISVSAGAAALCPRAP